MIDAFDKIEVNNLNIDCIIGVYPEERLRKQRLMVHLILEIDTRYAGRGGGLQATIDYAQLSGEVRFLLESCQFVLLEEAAEAIASWILAPRRMRRGLCIHRVHVAIAKPEAMGGRGCPMIRIERKTTDFAYEEETSVFGHVDVIYEIDALGIYELRIAPCAVLPAHFHKEMIESELILDVGIECQNELLQPGIAHFWPKGLVHTYRNTTLYEASILCVDRPKFVRIDEIESDTPLGLREEANPIRYFSGGMCS